MSSCVVIQPFPSMFPNVIPDATGFLMLINILSELRAQYEIYQQLKEVKTMTTCDGQIHKIEVAITDPNGRLIGLEKTEKGGYQFISESTHMSNYELEEQKKFINKIKQKYAYHRVIYELKKQGYVISEEEKVQNNTIRLVAKKWA